jgi:hypothetical protein
MPETKPVIPPSTGRRVLLFIASAVGAGINDKSRPFDAGIAFVWGDKDPVKNLINCGYTDHSGTAQSATSVVLYDRPQNDTDAHGKGETYAVWMPYQYEQALRAAQPKPAATEQRGGTLHLRKLEDNGAPVAGDEAEQP